jgi:membrane protease YdiL (CAAX protease family)
MNLLEASLLLGIIWALWHLPLVFVEGSFQNGLLAYPPSLIMYFTAFIPGSILMSWIYYRTNRSTLSAILFHFAGNAAGEMLTLELPTRVIQTVLACAVAAVVLGAEWPLFTQREFCLDFTSRGARRQGRHNSIDFIRAM